MILRGFADCRTLLDLLGRICNEWRQREREVCRAHTLDNTSGSFCALPGYSRAAADRRGRHHRRSGEEMQRPSADAIPAAPGRQSGSRQHQRLLAGGKRIFQEMRRQWRQHGQRTDHGARAEDGARQGHEVKPTRSWIIGEATYREIFGLIKILKSFKPLYGVGCGRVDELSRCWPGKAPWRGARIADVVKAKPELECARLRSMRALIDRSIAEQRALT